ncbi:hypothetical protein E2C01_017901 [Portunus trituberculatus]|uniref:Reverse transcriptase domain-containing protein n=1 Tax=Portunus trituberculatus TaxID=210409 RepID=A0A5B7DTP8_PORTR|nr:hypothetical protein [Portunus trituberculatus]
MRVYGSLSDIIFWIAQALATMAGASALAYKCDGVIHTFEETVFAQGVGGKVHPPPLLYFIIYATTINVSVNQLIRSDPLRNCSWISCHDDVIVIRLESGERRSEESELPAWRMVQRGSP